MATPLVCITHSTQENPVTDTPDLVATEEQLTEPVAEAAARVLRRHGVRVRTDAPHTRAGAVASWANRVGAAVLVDLHTDATGRTPNTTARGSSAFWHPGSVKGERLARLLLDRVALVGGVRRQLRARDDLIVLYGTDAVACLVELEFHDRADTANLVRDNPDAYGTAVARGVLDYLGVPYTPEPTTTTTGEEPIMSVTPEALAAAILDAPVQLPTTDPAAAPSFTTLRAEVAWLPGNFRSIIRALDAHGSGPGTVHDPARPLDPIIPEDDALDLAGIVRDAVTSALTDYVARLATAANAVAEVTAEGVQ